MALSLDRNEVIVYEVRRHWYVMLAQMISILFFVMLPVFLYAVLTSLPISITAEGNITALYLFVYMLWLLVAWMGVIFFWTDYYLDVMIITNKRLIRVEQYGLFSREVSYLDLQNIQDVKSAVHGLVATFLNFGDLTVQTAAQHREFVIETIARPFETRDKLNQAIALYNREHPQEVVFAGSLNEDKEHRMERLMSDASIMEDGKE